MAIETLGAALQQIDRLFAHGAVTGLSDAQLLERFISRRDTTAFEAMVARHGPMVLSVCRGILRDPNDAEDAFQATFMVLVKKGSSIRGRVILGGWLYQVAHRVAIEANKAAARRRAVEREAGLLACATRRSGPAVIDPLLPALHEEIGRLAEKHRLPVVLCDLEGMTQVEAAGQLQWSERTMRRRLAEARDRLKHRLTRRGLAPDGTALGAAFVRESGVVVPEAWRGAAVRAAGDFSVDAVASGAVTTTAQALMQDVLRTMLVHKLRWLSVALLALGAGGITMATVAVASGNDPGRRGSAARAVAAQQKPSPAQQSGPGEAPDDNRKPVSISGRVLDPDGQALPGASIYVQQYRATNSSVDETNVMHLVTRTGADGRFRFELDPTRSESPFGNGATWREALVAAVAPGLGPAWIAAGDAARTETDMCMVKDDRPIRGRIIDSEARPVAGATVRIRWLATTRTEVDLDALLASGKLDFDGTKLATVKRPMVSAPTWLGRDGSATTDADGRFELTGLGRDRVVVLRVEKPGHEKVYFAVLDRVLNRPRRPASELSPTFDTLYGETGLELYGTSFEHVVGPSKPITGIVQEKGTGRPAAGVTVAGQVPGRMWAVVMATTDERGHFRIDGLPKAESYRVDARPEPGSRYLGGQTQVVVDTAGLGPISLVLELARGVVVQGRLINKTTGQPVPCDWIEYFPLPGNASNSNRHGTSSASNHAFRITVPYGGGMIAVRARGQQVLYPGARLAPADKGRIQVKGDGGSPAGINLSVFHAYRFVDFAQGNESATVELEVTSSIAHSVELIGPTGRPVTGASAMGVTNDPFTSVTIDGARFEVQGLRPDESRFVEIRHEELGVGGSITVQGSDPADRPVVVKLARYGAITGRLLDEDGLPLRGAKVSAGVVNRRGIGESDPKFRARDAVSDEDGKFRVEGINPGVAVLLWIHKPGAPPYSHTPKPDKDLSNLKTAPALTLDVGDVAVRFQRVQ